MGKMKTISRIINLGWFFGLFYFQALLTFAFMLRRVKFLFQTRTTMGLLAGATLFLALGSIISMKILRKTQDDRVHNVLSIFALLLYVTTFIGMHLRQPMFSLVVCIALCMISLGYSAALVNSAMFSSLRLDKFAGRIIGLSAFFCCGLLTASTLLHAELLFLTIGLLLQIYYFCRPPKKHLLVRNRRLRSDLTVISTKRNMANYLSIMAVLGLRCGAGICLIVPLYGADSLFADFCGIAIFFGGGALLCGFLRDRMSRYLPMLSFCAVCLLMVVDTAFGSVSSNHVGMALSQCMAGCVFLYYICIATDFPIEDSPIKMLDKAVLVFLGFMGVSIWLLSPLLPLADGRTIIITISSLSIVVILIQLFYVSIYQSHETPETPFDVRLDIFKAQHAITVRENEVLSLVLTSEKSLKDIAGELFISISTLEKHMTSIYDKSHVKNRSELTHKFFAEEFHPSGTKAGNIKQI